MMDPAKLWRAWRKSKDSSDFEQLVHGEIPYARDLARRMGASPTEADDLVQESLLRLARERSDDPARVGLRAWICRRVVLGFKMHVRSSTRRRAHERASGGVATAIATDHPLDARDEVEAALAHLDPQARQAVVLRYLHDLDYREIAYILNITENACRLRVHKALKSLRLSLGGRAAMLIAGLGVSATAADAAIAQAALTAKVGFGSKIAAASVLAAAVTTTAVVVVPRDEAPPPPKVAIVTPSTAAPTGLQILDEHMAGRADESERFWHIDRVAESVKDTTRVLTFPPGEHELSLADYRWAKLEALSIKGAGKDRTVVRITSPLRIEGAIENLRISDLTLEGEGMVRVHGGTAAMFERVRFRGWEREGAPVEVTGRAYLGFRDCDFVGGYRRAAGGFALHVRGKVLALFDHCHFFDIDGVVHAAGKRLSVHNRANFVMCVLTRAPFARTKPLFPLSARACVAKTRDAGRHLSFGAEYLLKTTAPPRCTVKELRRVLAAIPLVERERIAGIRVITWEGAPGKWFAVHVARPEEEDLLLDANGRPADARGFTLPAFPSRAKLYSGPHLAEILAELPGQRPLSGILEDEKKPLLID